MRNVYTQFINKKWRVMVKRTMALFLIFVMLLGEAPAVYANGDASTSETTETAIVDETSAETETETESETESEVQSESETETESETQLESETETESETESESETEFETESEAESETETEASAGSQVQAEGEETAGKIFTVSDAGGSLPATSGAEAETYTSIGGTGTLTINFNDTFKTLNVSGNINVGALIITGNGTVNIGGNLIVSGDLQSTGDSNGISIVMQNKGDATIGGDIVLTNTTVSDAAYFGVADSAAGVKTLTVNNATFTNVAQVGVKPENKSVLLTVSGIPTLTSSAMYYDYPLSYFETDGTVIQPQDGWPTSYRVKTDETKPCFLVNGAEIDSFALPSGNQVIGYTLTGWKTTSTAQESVTALSVDHIGTTKLYANWQGNLVKVTWELDYTPDQYTNDTESPAFDCASVNMNAGAELTLPEPFRFGYDFAGWQVMKDGQDYGALLKGTVILGADLLNAGDVSGDAGTVTLALKAVWTVHTFPLKFQIGNFRGDTAYTINDVQFKTEKDAKWLTVEEFAGKYNGTFSDSDKSLKFADSSYGSTLGEYLESILPGLQIRTSDGSWYATSWQSLGITYDGSSKIAMGDNGLFGSSVPAGFNLQTYQAALHESQLKTLVTVWTENNTNIQFSDKKDWSNLWFIEVDGNDRTAEIKNATNTTSSSLTDVQIGAKVTFKVAADSAEANASFGLWTIREGNKRVSVTESVKDGYRCYTFTMPDTPVTATFSSKTEDVVFNMKESPVSEQKIVDVYGVWTNELIDNLTPRYDTTDGGLGYASNDELDGIDLADGWHNGDVKFEKMHYFYELPLNHYYYLTTNDAHIDQTSTIEEGNGTWNQWRGGQRQNVYLKDCHLWATTDYSKEELQGYITAEAEKTYFAGRMANVSNLYYYLTDGVTPSGSCYDQIFVGDNNIVGCIGVETYGQRVTTINDKTMVDIRIGARITNNNPGNQWYTPRGNFYPYAHTTYKDNFGYWTFGSYYPHGWGGIKVYLPHKIFSASQRYNLNGGYFHVRAINVMDINSNATLILEDDIPSGYRLDTITNANVIVRGDVAMTTTLTIKNGSLTVLGDVLRCNQLYVDSNSSVIANAIETQAIDSSGTILTNSIRNLSVKFEANYQTINSNGDDTGYQGYIHATPRYVDNTNNANISYKFAGGNVYLFGYETAATVGRGPLKDLENPLYFYVNVLPVQENDENGYPKLNLDGYTEFITTMKSGLQAKGAELYEANKSVNADKECFYLGQSANDSRKFAFSGANIYSAGRMTLNNGAIISDGKIYASALSSKWDLIISGGMVEAKEIGNAADVQVTRLDGTKRYAKTEITGGTIKADRIGVLSTSTAREIRSSLVTLSADSINAYTNDSKITLVHDALVYYSIDTKKYTASSTDSFPIRITADYDNSKNLEEQSWTLVEPGQAGEFATLSYAAGTGTGEVKWSLSQTEGIFVTKYDATGNLLDGTAVTASVAARDGVTLYAIEVSPMTLSVLQDGDYISGITANGKDVTVEDSQSGYNSEYAILSGAAVEVTIDPSMKDKVLFLYRDDQGIIHNLFPTVSDDGTKITFNMPFRACELHVTSRFTLYLNRHHIVFPANGGFRTELISENADRAFDYAGDIYITRDDGKDAQITSYELRFEDDFNNSNGRKIILHDLNLKMQTGSAVDITLHIDGSNGKKVYFAGGERQYWFDGKLTFCGLNGKDTDVLKTGWYVFWGRMDKFAFENLHVVSEGLIYPNASTTDSSIKGHLKEAFFDNCKIEMIRHNLGTSIFHNNAGSSKAYFTDCEVILGENTRLSDVSSSNLNTPSIKIFFTRCKVVNNSELKLMESGTLALDNSTITNSKTPTESQVDNAIRITSLTMKNGSEFYSSNSIYALTITLTDGSELYGGFNPATNAYSGRLSSNNFTVESGAKAYAKYILCAGARDCNGTSWQVQTNGTSYSGITVNGGSIYATEFIGSDLNSEITVTGSGYMESKYIGTYGKIFNVGIINTNFPLYHPDESKVRNSTIQIEDGSTVKILDGGYLGGGTSTITIDNATVEGAAGDILGKTITISGANAEVYVDELIADDSLTITDASGKHFTNGYQYNDRKHNDVAVYVETELRAHKILINKGALVYAANAHSYALAGEEAAEFTVAPGSGAELYTVNYGYLGGGEHILNFVANNDNGNQTIWGGTVIGIRYNLGDLYGESADDVVMSTDNPDSYVYTKGDIIKLEPLSHPYLEFVEWQDGHGNSAPTVNKGIIPSENVVERVAVWKPKSIQFKVVIDKSVFSEGSDFEKEVPSEGGTLDSNAGTFTWKENTGSGYLEGAYKDILQGSSVESENLFKYSEHLLPAHTITLIHVYTADGTKRLDNEDNTVTRAMIDAYYKDYTDGEKPEPLIIKVALVAETALTMKFHLNKKDGKPDTAKFNGTRETTVEVYAKTGAVFRDVDKAKYVDDLADLSATGYEFLGWSTDPDADPDTFKNKEFKADGKVGVDITEKEWYAVWKPKQYHVRFYASSRHPDGGTYYMNTDGSTELPTGDGSTATGGSLEGVPYSDIDLTYDEPIDWSGHTVPTVWREGQVFKTWYYVKTDNAGQEVAVEVKEDEIFTLTNNHFNSVDFDKGEGDGNTLIITFYALYEPLKINYDLNGGQWYSKTTEDTELYKNAGTPLRAYSGLTTGVTSANYTDVSDATITGYSVISTTAAYFKSNNNTYVNDDYRYTLGRQGYTFAGWFLDSDCTEPITETPKFSREDITVYAKWVPNTYSLTLHAADPSYQGDGASKAAFTLKKGDTYEDNKDNKVEDVSVTVGELISSENWPTRDTWGTRASGADSTNPRPLWGFVFQPMDPWYPGVEDSEASKNYVAYNEAVKQLYKAGALFVENSRFTLPKTYLNGDAIPDYPDGAEIDMYAAYNEFALVFVQYYQSKTGEITQRIIETVQYGAVSTYTLQALADLEVKITDAELKDGYTSLGWYVNTTTVNPEKKYDVKDFNNLNGEKFLAYKEEALKDTNTYDIIVYHIYAADETLEGVTLTSDPVAQVDTNNIDESRVYEIEIPMNMQPGTLYYSFKTAEYSENYMTKDENGDAVHTYGEEPYNGTLNFVETLKSYDYDTQSNVGLNIQVIRDGETSSETSSKYLSSEYTGNPTSSGSTGINVQPGDRLRLTLDHSYVITEESEHTFDLAFFFKDSDGDEITGQQLLLDDVKVTLKPSEYDVVFHSGTDGKTVLKPGSFTEGETLAVKATAATVFQSIAEMPTILGYTHKAYAGTQVWHVRSVENETDFITVNGETIKITGTPTYSVDGKLLLYAAWEANEHTFTVNKDVLREWKVEYKNGETWTQIGSGTDGESGDEKKHAVKLLFNTEIKFTPSKEVPSNPEFVELAIDDQESQRLDIDIQKGDGGSYTWSMPDADVDVEIRDTLDLFLDNGDIILTKDSFYQDRTGPQNVWHKWSGNYRIRQNLTDDVTQATEHTLTINGDMNGRSIALGALNISAKDSISLDKYPSKYENLSGAESSAIGQNVTLTLPEGEVKAANILMPSDNGAGATLTVEGFGAASKLTLTPKNGDSAIGQTGGSAFNPISIAISDCAVTVNETGEYVGTWFGGTNTNSVTLNNVTLNQPTPEWAIAGRYVTKAKTVTLNNCAIGTDTQRIAEPIYAEGTLTINGGTLYMEPGVPQEEVSMIGTANTGTIEIDKNVSDSKYAVINIKYSGNNRSGRPFTGTMLLNDKNSYVVIDNMLVLDTKYGTIDISESDIAQGGVVGIGAKNTAHTGQYLILQEFDDAAVNVTVSAEKTITLQQPKEGEMHLDTVSVKADTTLRSQTNAAGTACTFNIEEIAIENAVLTVNLAAQDTIKLKKDFGNSTGSYVQSGGLLKSDGDIKGRALDIELEDVTVTAKNLVAKNLTLEDSTVNCIGSTSGEGGSDGSGSEGTSGNGVVGSYGAEDGAGYVTLIGDVKIEAAKLGALGEHNKTYTGVIIEDGAQVVFDGTLVQDHYRMAYALDTKTYKAPEYTVFRTTQEGMTGAVTAVGDDVPEKPARRDNKEDKLFKVWYYVYEDNRYALTTEDAIPEGYFANDTLDADLVNRASDPAEDNTRTLTIYAGMHVTGEAYIRSGRNFVHRDYESGTSEYKDSVLIPANSAWTMSLTVKDALDGGHYELDFSAKTSGGDTSSEGAVSSVGTTLPVGTKLTLVTFDGNKLPTYYYSILEQATDKLDLSEFKSMTGGSAPVLPGAGSEDRIVVAADFSNANAAVVANSIVTLQYVYAAQAGETADRVDLAEVTLSVNAVDGAIAVEGNKVTVTAPTSSVYAKKTLAVVAEFVNEGFKLPYDAAAMLNDSAENASGSITGTPLSGNKFLFKLGNAPSDSYTCSFSGIYGDAEIRWYLVAMEDANNLNALNAVVGQIGDITHSFGEKPVQGRLSAEIRTIDDAASESRVLTAGTQHKVVLGCDAEGVSAVTVTVEKQQGLLANFVTMGDRRTTSDGSVEVTIPGDAGVYRVCLSIDESTSNHGNDNVYFVFVVE